MTAKAKRGIDAVDLMWDAEELGPFWVAGLALEAWPVLTHRLDELSDLGRMAVEHYSSIKAEKKRHPFARPKRRRQAR